MSINEISSSDLISGVLATAYSSVIPQTNSIDYTAGSSDDISISTAGMLRNAIEDMSESDQTEMESFRQTLTESVENGSFDAATLAEDAPEALVEFAEENGLELTDMLQEMADGIEAANNTYAPPPPPPPSESSSGLDLSSLQELSDEEKSELKSFMEELRESIEDGTFDAETIAASAPDSLTTLAEENDMELTELVQQMSDEIEDAPPPPPPPMMAGPNMEEEEYDYLSQFASTETSE